MKNNRRAFLKLSGLAGAGILSSTVEAAVPDFAKATVKNPAALVTTGSSMHGFAAPKLETVRIGCIGIGSRGSAAVQRLNTIEGVSIIALCDIKEAQVLAAKKRLEGSRQNPVLYSGKADEWKKVCERKDIDLIYVTTPWALHTPIAVYAMEHGKHVVTEIPSAKTVEECWQLVETSNVPGNIA